MNNLKIGTAVVLLLILAFYAGRATAPGQKSAESQKVAKNVTTIIREVKRADGSTETVTEIVDKTKESSSKQLTVVAGQKQNLILSATASASADQTAPVYGLLVQKSILNKVIIGLGANTDKQAMLTVGWSF